MVLLFSSFNVISSFLASPVFILAGTTMYSVLSFATLSVAAGIFSKMSLPVIRHNLVKSAGSFSSISSMKSPRDSSVALMISSISSLLRAMNWMSLFHVSSLVSCTSCSTTRRAMVTSLYAGALSWNEPKSATGVTVTLRPIMAFDAFGNVSWPFSILNQLSSLLSSFVNVDSS